MLQIYGQDNGVDDQHTHSKWCYASFFVIKVANICNYIFTQHVRLQGD
jgi:hypothetical protein